MGVLDWLTKRRYGESSTAFEWRVRATAGEIVVEDGRGGSRRAPLFGARSVRVVPLSGGDQHRATRGGWQVALSRDDGDVLVGGPLAEWRSARDLARLICETAELPLDELTEKLFSRVGQFAPAREK